MRDFLERYFFPLARLERWIFPLAFAAGVIATVYWYWTTTPSYALTSVIDSVRHHDIQTFEKYVDIDSIASNAFDNVLEGPARNEVLGKADSVIGVGFLRFFKRDIVGVAHQKIIDVVGDPALQLETAADPTLESLGRHRVSAGTRQTLIDLGLTRSGFKGMKYLDINGSKALLGLEFHSPRLNTNYVIEFKMEDAGGFWRVTELTNLNDLVSRYLQTRSRA